MRWLFSVAVGVAMCGTVRGQDNCSSYTDQTCPTEYAIPIPPSDHTAPSYIALPTPLYRLTHSCACDSVDHRVTFYPPR